MEGCWKRSIPDIGKARVHAAKGQVLGRDDGRHRLCGSHQHLIRHYACSPRRPPSACHLGCHQPLTRHDHMGRKERLHPITWACPSMRHASACRSVRFPELMRGVSLAMRGEAHVARKERDIEGRAGVVKPGEVPSKGKKKDGMALREVFRNRLRNKVVLGEDAPVLPRRRGHAQVVLWRKRKAASSGFRQLVRQMRKPRARVFVTSSNT